jgi:hypothetical protein
MLEIPQPKLSVAEATSYLTTTVPTWQLSSYTWPCLDGRTATVKCWANAPPTLRDFWDLTKGFKERTLMVQYDSAGKREESATYGEADARINAWGAWLDEIGVKKGDRVAIGSRNNLEWPVALFGTTSVGWLVDLRR